MLGEVEVVGDDGVELPVRGIKQRALLLTLLVRANETVPADRLADELWGEDVPAGGANALQAQVSTLRRALGPAGSSIDSPPGTGPRQIVHPGSVSRISGVVRPSCSP